MITKQRSLFYFVGKHPYASLEEAQQVDLMSMLPPEFGDTREAMVSWLMKNSEAIVRTLTTTPRSRVRKPRSDIGKKRASKEEIANQT